MKPVTDPYILSQLEGSQNPSVPYGKIVTDPDLLDKLNSPVSSNAEKPSGYKQKLVDMAKRAVAEPEGSVYGREASVQDAKDLAAAAAKTTMGVGEGLTLGFLRPQVEKANKSLEYLGVTPSLAQDRTFETLGSLAGTGGAWSALSKVAPAITYLPNTSRLNRIVNQAATGGIVGGATAQNVGDNAIEGAIGGAVIGGTVQSAIELPGAIRESVWFRKMTIPERNLVVQTAADLRRNGYSEGQISRMKPEEFKSAFEARMKTETPISEPIPTPAPATVRPPQGEFGSRVPEPAPVAAVEAPKTDIYGQEVLGRSGDTVTLYHGGSSDTLDAIRKTGIIPNKKYGLGLSEVEQARLLAQSDASTRGAKDDVIYKVEIPREEITRLEKDHASNDSPEWRMYNADVKNGNIKPEWIKEVKIGRGEWQPFIPTSEPVKAGDTIKPEVWQSVLDEMNSPINNGSRLVKGKTGPATESDFTQNLAPRYPSLFSAGKRYPKEAIKAAVKRMVEGKPLTENQKEIIRNISDDINNQPPLKTEVSAMDLKVGDTMTINGEKFKVTEETPDGIVVKDGKPYELAHEQIFSIDEGSLQRGEVPRFETTPTGEQQAVIPGAQRAFGKTATKGGQAVGTSELMDGFTPDPQQELFGKKAMADTGGYDMASVPTPTEVKPIEMPEIVEIAKELMGGKLPYVARRLRNSRALGLFYPQGTGDIKLLAKLFNTPGLAERVLAHEVGHLADYVPDRTMKRGNILGRIASLRNYMKQTLEAYEGAPGTLTEQERRRLRYEAEKELKANERPEETIIETITREVPEYRYTGITPDMIKELLGVDAREKYPKLFRAFQEMDTAEKKAVLVQAMKGFVHDSVSRFGERVQTGTRTVTEQVSRTIPGISATPEQIAKRYAEMVQEEIDKRNLYKWETINQELRDLTLHWKPFEPGNNQFTKYRFSSKELYADAMSVLLNNPALLRQIAPTFERAFFSYMGRKPEARDIYYEIQQRLNDPDAVGMSRLEAMYNMHQEADLKRQDYNARMENEGEGIIDSIAKRLVDERWAAKKVVDEIRKATGNNEIADKALQKLEDLPYLSSEFNQILYEFNNAILKPMEEAGVSNTDLSIYLFAKQIIAEGNADAIKAAAKGHTPQTAARLLVDLERKLGAEKYNALTRIAQEQRRFRENQFIAEYERSGYFTSEQIRMMKERTDYVRINLQKFLEEDSAGLGGFSANIYQKFGSLEDIENTFISTLMQDLSFLRAVRINESKAVFSALLDSAGGDYVSIPEMKYSLDKKGLVPVEPKHRDLAVLRYKVDGKWQYRVMDKELVDAFEHNPVIATKFARFWSVVTQPFKELFVSKNPAWLLRNIPKDFQRSLQNVDIARLRDSWPIAKMYFSTFKDVWRYAHGKERTPQIEQLLREKAIPVKRTWASKDESFEDEMVRMMTNYGLSATAEKDHWKIVKFSKDLWNWLDNTAASSDYWGKVAIDKWLRQQGITDAKRIKIIRDRVATPNGKNRGLWNAVLNNLFMFSNMGVQGTRSAYQSFKENKTRYMWKMFNMNILPKLILGAISVGLMGNELKKVTDKIPDYDKRLYMVIPLFIDSDGKAHYIRIPMDYEGQFISSLVWNLAHAKLVGRDSALSSLESASPYSLHPLLQLGMVTGEYLATGGNPSDSFTGSPIMTDDEAKAGGKYAAKALSKYSYNKIFSSIYRMETGGVKPDASDLEKFFKTYPFNALGSFYRISDRGDDERIREAVTKVQKDAAGARIESQQAMKKLVEGKRLTPDEQTAIAVHPGDFSGNMAKMMTKKHNIKYVHALQKATTAKEKLAILQLMEENK